MLQRKLVRAVILVAVLGIAFGAGFLGLWLFRKDTGNNSPPPAQRASSPSNARVTLTVRPLDGSGPSITKGRLEVKVGAKVELTAQPGFDAGPTNLAIRIRNTGNDDIVAECLSTPNVGTRQRPRYRPCAGTVSSDKARTGFFRAQIEFRKLPKGTIGVGGVGHWSPIIRIVWK